MISLPTHWEQNLLIVLLIALPIAFFAPLLMSLRGRALARPRQSSSLALWKRCLSVLLAYVMLLTPGLESIAQGAAQYSQLSTTQWASGNRTIEYQYDANGSCTQKVTKETSTGTVLETIDYDHNLRNKLERITKNTYDGSDTYHEITEYTYNDEGMRVKSDYYYTVNADPTKNDEQIKVFLIDSYNPTGYAQILEELSFNKANPDLSTDTPDSVTSYIIGDDVIAQTINGVTDYLLYDGHGSTRQLAEYSAGAVNVVDSYSYDGYGVLLQNDSVASTNPGKVAVQATNLLYAGEQFDTDAQQYYLRARYYAPLNGRFNQVDPYAGNNQDPQSLHKYLYAHADPINNVDPSGQMEFSLIGMMQVAFVSGLMTANIAGWTSVAKGMTSRQVLSAVNKWFWVGFGVGAAAYGTLWSARLIWLWLYGGSQLISNPEIQTRLHHFASNKHSYWTPQFEDIVSKYGLKLNDAWNLGSISTKFHNSAHPEAYHKWVLLQMTRAANEAGQAANRFIILYQEYVVLPVMKNPEMLKSEFWPKGS